MLARMLGPVAIATGAYHDALIPPLLDREPLKMPASTTLSLVRDERAWAPPAASSTGANRVFER
jgi:hypothetical protein